jgi:hypothetical protein
MTTGEWLDEWFAGKRDLRGTTHRYYHSNIRLYLKPRLGDIPLDRLRVTHLDALFSWIEETNHTRRRPVGQSTMQRIRATLRSALSDAVRQGLVARNVAKDIRLPSGKKPKARVWTAARVTAFDAECRRRAEQRHSQRTKHRRQEPRVTFKEWSSIRGHPRSWFGHRPRPAPSSAAPATTDLSRSTTS